MSEIEFLRGVFRLHGVEHAVREPAGEWVFRYRGNVFCWWSGSISELQSGGTIRSWSKLSEQVHAKIAGLSNGRGKWVQTAKRKAKAGR